MKKQKNDIFNPAFADLKKLFKRAEKKQAAEAVDDKLRRSAGKATRPGVKPPRVEEIPQRVEERPQRGEETPERADGKPPRVEKRSRRVEASPQRVLSEDELLFNEAMRGVTPISSKKPDKIFPSGKAKRSSRSHSDNEDEVVAHLKHLVEGSIDMDITFSDEYVEGSVSGVSRNIMRKLKRGRIPVQDHIDLHGYTKKDAEDLVRKFLVESQRKGFRCVLIVHGRGLNSPDSIPILKERLPVWLNRGPVRKIVLAFSSAMPYDGGTGALYVLLRRG